MLPIPTVILMYHGVASAPAAAPAPAPAPLVPSRETHHHLTLAAAQSVDYFAIENK